MIRSRRRAVVFPQADHARLADTLALAWRDRPALPFDSFVRGVADHDRGYGEYDNDELGVTRSTGAAASPSIRGRSPCRVWSGS